MGEVPDRADFAMNVRAAVDVAAGSGRAGFEAELDRRGIFYRANVASTGKVNGYSFSDRLSRPAESLEVPGEAVEVAGDGGCGDGEVAELVRQVWPVGEDGDSVAVDEVAW